MIKFSALLKKRISKTPNIPKEALDFICLSEKKNVKGTIIGKEPKTGKLVCIPNESNISRNTFVVGCAGSGKTRCFTIPQIKQYIKNGESIFITDVYGLIYDETIEELKANEYNIKILDTDSPENFNFWNPLEEIFENNEISMFKLALLSKTFMSNTNGNNKDPYFIPSLEEMIFKSLCLYIVVDENNACTYKTLNDVKELLESKQTEINNLFESLPNTHIAKEFWHRNKLDILSKDNVWFEAIADLISRMNFLKPIDNKKEHINISNIATEKCAYFIKSDFMEDNPMAAMFISFTLSNCCKMAESNKNEKCLIPINFFLDEIETFFIDDLDKILAICRKRNIIMHIICQDINQIRNKYGNSFENAFSYCTVLCFGTFSPYTIDFLLAYANNKISSEEICLCGCEDIIVFIKEIKPFLLNKITKECLSE